MKLTSERLNELILECLEEHRGSPMKNRGVKGQRIARQRNEENQENTKRERQHKDRIWPGLRSLISLGRGVVEEADVKDEGEWVKIRKTSLDRLLIENQQQLLIQCNKAGMKTMQQWLQVTNAFADAGKGKFGEEKK